MKIKCWGARGSIPVSGPEYNVYGGDTTCIEITTKNNETIIIDAGSGIRRLGQKLLDQKRSNIALLFTHSHWDHILGFPFFAPCYQKKTSMQLYGCPFAQDSIKNYLDGLMKAPYFPIRIDDIKASLSYNRICLEKSFQLYSITVEPILLSHPNMGIGYKFIEDGKSFVFLTDNELTLRHPDGLVFDDYLKFCTGADLLIHDSEFTTKEYNTYAKGWGHTVYTDALDLAIKADVGRFGLFHHNAARTDQAVDIILKDCQSIIKEKKSKLNCFAASQNLEIKM
ncbi:MAG: MBL fold metallo-hydrolase [Bacteriovoracaceae bacterium]|nr:MBL fold metallo-hydrolase [Bacteriovoracaceae bacterium]